MIQLLICLATPLPICGTEAGEGGVKDGFQESVINDFLAESLIWPGARPTKFKIW